MAACGRKEEERESEICHEWWDEWAWVCPSLPVNLPHEETNTSAESNIAPEVIRAPKVELSGLKVVGKIELRTPKKKEEVEGEQEEKEVEGKPTRTRFRNDRNRKINKPRKPKLSIAEQRQREEKIKQRKKKEAAAEAKIKRKENYLKKVKAKEKAAAKKLSLTPVEKPKAKVTENVGIFRKFFNWMRRE